MPEEKNAGNKTEETLLGLRRELDRIDSSILVLLNRRAEISMEIGGLKKKAGLAVHVPEREEQLLRALVAQSAGPLGEAQIRNIYQAVFCVSKDLQGGTAD